MKKITTKAELLEIVKDLLAVENLAREEYISNIKRFKDVEIIDTYKKIKTEEDLHINTLKRIIKLIEGLK